MSQLRKQLQTLKADYGSAQYPGNLADELLAPARSSHMRIFAWTATAGSIAAMIVVALMHFTVVTQPSPIKPTVIVSNMQVPGIKQTIKAVPATTAAEDTSVVPVTNLASAPAFPTDSSLVPSGESMVPSASSFDFGSMPSTPSLPSLDLNADNSSTTKESV